MTGVWDEAEWGALAAELDAWRAERRTATLWWRDDDAGRPDPALDALLALADALAVPLALAVVPAWLHPEAARAIDAAPAAIAVLQHGFAHTNHETEIAPGEPKVRFAECGGARPVSTVLAEIAEGHQRLRVAFSARCLPGFVPPWNRIAAEVMAALPPLGYRALSTFGPRPTAEPAAGLLQVNCHVDPIVWREGKRFAGAGPTLVRLRSHLVARRGGRVDPAEPTGLLTHHHDLTPPFWEFLANLLRRLSEHPAVAFPPLPDLLAPSPRPPGGDRAP